jgi:hypothetical protein
MEPQQLPALDSPLDRAVAQAGFDELRPRHDAELLAGHLHHRPVQTCPL